jgi:hypothetical protein
MAEDKDALEVSNILYQQKLSGAEVMAKKFQREAKGNLARLMSAHIAIARLSGYIERVREMDRAGPVEEIAGLERTPRQKIDELLQMGDQQFDRTIDAMGHEELDDLMGRTDDPREQTLR